MARKSRKHIEVNKQELQKTTRQFSAALYVRLSNEERFDRANKNSFKNQKAYLLDYVEKHPEISIYKIYEDNGNTGTNFDRPAFSEMMYDVSNEKVDCIIVKDLSRFDNDSLIIDDVSGRIVARLFDMLDSGISPTSVAATFNAEGILTPADYKKLQNCTRKWKYDEKKSYWTDGTVRRIASDEKYTGKMVLGKTERLKVGDPCSARRKPAEQWIVVENTHPAIVSKEKFDRVAEKIHTRKNHHGNKINHKPSIYCCGYCGHTLQKSGKKNLSESSSSMLSAVVKNGLGENMPVMLGLAENKSNPYCVYIYEKGKVRKGEVSELRKGDSVWIYQNYGFSYAVCAIR